MKIKAHILHPWKIQVFMNPPWSLRGSPPSWVLLPCPTIPGSSKYVKFAPFHLKKLPRGRNFTYLEDPGMSCVSFPPLEVCWRWRWCATIWPGTFWMTMGRCNGVPRFSHFFFAEFRWLWAHLRSIPSIVNRFEVAGGGLNGSQSLEINISIRGPEFGPGEILEVRMPGCFRTGDHEHFSPFSNKKNIYPLQFWSDGTKIAAM